MFNLMGREAFASAIRKYDPNMVEPFLDADHFLGDGETYLSYKCLKDQKRIWISGMLGHKAFWVIIKLKSWAKANGYDTIGFKMKRDNPVHEAFIKWTKAISGVENETGVDYIISLNTEVNHGSGE